MLKKKKLLIGGLILGLALGYLLYVGLGSSMAYYSTVSELMQKGDSIYGKEVRVNGDVVPDSIERNGLILTFNITGEGESLSVIYQGVVVPDTFKDGAEVVVQGELDSDGVFQANTILAKCPSKYVPEE